MKVSARGRALIKEFEGLRLEAYRCSAGKWTIGYGSTRGVKEGDVITEAGAEARLVDDLRWAEAAVERQVRVGLTQNQFDALASFVFNLGESALSRSTLLRKLNGKDYLGAADELPRWSTAGGQVLSGLQRRRMAERAFFLGEPRV